MKKKYLFATIIPVIFASFTLVANAYNPGSYLRSTSNADGTVVNVCGGIENDPNCSNTCFPSSGICYANNHGWRVERHTCAENQVTYRNGLPVCETGNPERFYSYNGSYAAYQINASCSQVQQIDVFNQYGQAVDWIVWRGNCTGNGSGGGTNNGGLTGKCESINNQYASCTIQTSIAVPRYQLNIQQISNTTCKENVNWGYNEANKTFWTNYGCRFNYTVNTYYNPGPTNPNITMTARCESVGYSTATNYCTLPANATGFRQISSTACIQGTNWGFSNGSAWVRNGCRGEFTYTSSTRSCPSGYTMWQDGICRDQG